MKRAKYDKKVKAAISGRSVLLVVLAFLGWASSSYAGGNCAANYAGLASLPDGKSGGACSKEVLKSKISQAKGVYKATGSLLPIQVEVVDFPERKDFFVKVNGSESPSLICCQGGRWTTQDGQALPFGQNSFSVKGMKFQRVSELESSRTRVADTRTSGGTDGG